MNTLQTLAVLKAAAYMIPVGVLMPTRWRWLTAALIVLVAGNLSVALGAERLTSSVIGLAFLPLFMMHVFDVTRYSKP